MLLERPSTGTVLHCPLRLGQWVEREEADEAAKMAHRRDFPGWTLLNVEKVNDDSIEK